MLTSKNGVIVLVSLLVIGIFAGLYLDTVTGNLFFNFGGVRETQAKEGDYLECRSRLTTAQARITALTRDLAICNARNITGNGSVPPPPVATAVSCIDSDGFNLRVKGNITIGYSDGTTWSISDFCRYGRSTDPYTVTEYTCQSNSNWSDGFVQRGYNCREYIGPNSSCYSPSGTPLGRCS